MRVLRRGPKPRFALIGFMFLLGLTACDSQTKPQLYEITGQTMGTYFKVSLVETSGFEAETLESAITKRLADINSLMSTYQADSQISRFNQLREQVWFDVSPELVTVTDKAINIARQSGGVFDPTIGPMVNLWNFGPMQQPTQIPSDNQLKSVKQFIGVDKLQIRLQPAGLKKDIAQLELDLSAIAKGYAVDEVANLLTASGHVHFLIDIGGELRASGYKLDGQLWRVGIEKPLAGTDRQLQQVINIENKSIATSGSYRNFFEQNGVRYSHIINPQSGKPIHHKLVSVSVISEDCMTADAYSTTLMVLGPDQGYDFALQYGLAVYMIVKTGDEFVAKFTPQMKPFME